MKTTITTTICFLFALFFLALTGCNKDEDPTPVDLMIGKWTVGAVDATITVNGQPYVTYLKTLGFSDAEAQLYAKELTDSFEEGISGTLELKKDGTYVATDDSGIDPSTGKWELSADAKKMTLDKGTSDEQDYTVKTLTASKLDLSADIQDFDGTGIRIQVEIALSK